MTKKQVALLFMLISTIVSILIMLIVFVVLFAILVFISKASPNVLLLGLTLVFVLSMFGGTIISQKLMTWSIKKFKLEDKMAPLWNTTNKTPKDN